MHGAKNRGGTLRMTCKIYMPLRKFAPRPKKNLTILPASCRLCGEQQRAGAFGKCGAKAARAAFARAGGTLPGEVSIPCPPSSALLSDLSCNSSSGLVLIPQQTGTRLCRGWPLPLQTQAEVPCSLALRRETPCFASRKQAKSPRSLE